MAMLPRGHLRACAAILEKFPLETAGDFFAADDSEVLDFVNDQDQATRTAWAQLVAWARTKHTQTGLRIYEEGLKLMASIEMRLGTFKGNPHHGLDAAGRMSSRQPTPAWIPVAGRLDGRPHHLS